MFKQLLALCLLGALLSTVGHATISSTTNQTITANGNGATVNFTIGFSFLDNDYIEVYLEDTSVTPHTRTLKAYGGGASQYTITGGDPGTTVHMGTAPASTERLVIKRATPHTQTVNYDENSAFPADDHEEQMDKMVEVLQEQQSAIDTKVGLAAGSTSSTPTFPEPQASSYIRYNGSSVLEARTAAQTITDLGVLKASNNLSDLTSVSTALSNLGISSLNSLPPLGSANTVLHVNSGASALSYDKLTTSNLDAAAGIVDTQLATIATAGKVSNSATTATAANTASTIMARDGSGQVAATTFTGALVGNATTSSSTTGNAATATALAANPAACSAGQFVTDIDANGTLTCSTPAGAGDVTGQASSVDSEVVLFSGTSGKLIKRATGTGLVPVTSGVYGTPGALTGDVTTSGAGLATTAAATQANIVTLSKSTGVAVHGTNTNDNAATNYVGEYFSISNTAQSFPTSGQYGDCGGTSITIGAGDWDISLVASANSATTGTAGFYFGISTHTGNDSTGLVAGDNFVNEQFNFVTNSGDNSVAIPNYRMSVSGSTIVYCKVESTYTGSPKYDFRMSARRVR